jgi:hypothetical protein
LGKAFPYPVAGSGPEEVAFAGLLESYRVTYKDEMRKRELGAVICFALFHALSSRSRPKAGRLKGALWNQLSR